MKKFIRPLAMSALTMSSLILNCSYSNADDHQTPLATDRAVYFGVEYGASIPVKKSFIEDGNTLTLKKSHMTGGKIGYSFYPQMNIEYSYSYQPVFKLGYNVPAGSFGDFIGESRVIAHTHMLNLVYELDRSYLGLQPYAIFGVGLCQVNVKSSEVTRDLPHPAPVFRVKKHTTNALAYQFGFGISKEILPNLSIDGSVKIQVAQDVLLKSEALSPSTRKFEDNKTIKKTLGVTEVALGITYRLPF